MGNKNKFTLIELLVVVVILAILIAILLPTLAKAREETRFIQCTSNMRQMGMGTNLFFQENDKFTGYNNMIKGQWNSGISNVKNGDLYPYVQDLDVYKCPSFDAMLHTLNQKSDYDFIFSYCFNHYVHDRTRQEINDMHDPMAMALMSEENPYKFPGYSNHSLNDSRVAVRRDPGTTDTIGTFHKARASSKGKIFNGYSNVLFLDLHCAPGWYEDDYELMNPGDRIKSF